MELIDRDFDVGRTTVGAVAPLVGGDGDGRSMLVPIPVISKRRRAVTEE
jgi:hypothetical protein